MVFCLWAYNQKVPEYYYAFGPTVDGVVIDTDFDTDRQSYINRLASYDLIFGVTPSDAFFTFNDEDIRFGFETDKRNKILRTFIRNTYNYHLTEIMATVVNEYTDWERTVRHPISTREETLALLSDALYAAPVMHSGNLHALASRATFLYVFDHQTRNGDFEHQRLGCVHGEELPYVWGAPLVDSLAHFPYNYTQVEIKLSEIVITYWTNFARTGNPSEPASGANDRVAEKGRGRIPDWPTFDTMHRKYIDIDVKPRMKAHYRSHQLSFWLQLVPQLHQAGRDAPDDHHQLENHNDWDSYNGFVRSQPVTRVILPPETTTVATTTRQYNVSAVLQSTPASPDTSNGTGRHASLSDGFAAYSTALSVTIAIGCSLLILNVLIFAGVYYQRDKSRMEAKKVAENGGLLPAHSISGDVHTPSTPSLSVKAEVASRMGSSGMKPPPSTPMSQTTHLPPPEFADYPNQSPHYGTAHGVSHLHTLPRKTITCESQPGGGTSLTLSVPRAPPPPQIPCQGTESQPLLKQTSFSVTSPHTSTPSKSPTKDSHAGELRV
ncbi:hypothetical protein Pcinc_014072 [Petrolisthes cinctipes]|uniref:Carboxylesterase type B domain-containing protein n=2 Tax=Petrolisthes cinctipes TaxID=88211 RepID=A0AAE1FW37_PETCI|nr:hypothetical protein Pcinc_014072 [Petrolisthes cinctipes]